MTEAARAERRQRHCNIFSDWRVSAHVVLTLLLSAPDGTQVPQLAVCDFGYGHNAAPNARESQNAPVPTPQGRILEPQL